MGHGRLSRIVKTINHQRNAVFIPGSIPAFMDTEDAEEQQMKQNKILLKNRVNRLQKCKSNTLHKILLYMKYIYIVTQGPFHAKFR